MGKVAGDESKYRTGDLAKIRYMEIQIRGFHLSEPPDPGEREMRVREMERYDILSVERGGRTGRPAGGPPDRIPRRFGIMNDIRKNVLGVPGRSPRESGYSMIEILMVIGIIGILVGLGTAGYMTQMSSSRVESGIQILDASIRQARQGAISMRRTRRVVIDAGRLEGFVDSKMTGMRIARAAVWVEGKVCEEYPFDTGAWCSDKSGKTPNAYPVGDTAYFPDGIMVADVDRRMPGVDGNPQVFYIEFNARGAIAKVYFQGEESSTTYNAIAPVIHLARDSEVFSVAGGTGDYKYAIGKAGSKSLQWGAEDAGERYKVQTIEVVRLTGRTRSYNYAILNPWPLDEWKQK